MDTVEKEEWRLVLARTAWPTVEKEHGGGEGLDPERERHGCVDEHGADDVVECAKGAFCTTVLG